MKRIPTIFAVAATITLLSSPLFAQDRTAELLARFEREPNPVAKARLMSDLGDAEFVAINKNVNDRNIRGALLILQKYLEQVQLCEKGLDRMKTDAEKHPAGFKQLQFSLRGSLRRLDNLIVGLTTDDQGPFIAARRELNELDMHLLRELFPHEPKN